MSLERVGGWVWSLAVFLRLACYYLYLFCPLADISKSFPLWGMFLEDRNIQPRPGDIKLGKVGDNRRI